MSDECRFCPTCHDHWHNPLNEPELENCQNCNPQVMQGVVVFPDGSRLYKNMTSEQVGALAGDMKPRKGDSMHNHYREEGN